LKLSIGKRQSIIDGDILYFSLIECRFVSTFSPSISYTLGATKSYRRCSASLQHNNNFLRVFKRNAEADSVIQTMQSVKWPVALYSLYIVNQSY